MNFVPFVPPPTTRRARELAKALDRVIEGHRGKDPRLTARDVRRALQIVGSRQGNPDKVILLIMVALGLVVFLLAVGMFASRG